LITYLRDISPRAFLSRLEKSGMGEDMRYSFAVLLAAAGLSHSNAAMTVERQTGRLPLFRDHSVLQAIFLMPASAIS
jgi:hypothetical protein